MKINVKKLMFFVRMFLGSFLILFSGIMTLPIYIAIKTSNGDELFAAIVLCVFSLAVGHWWIKRAYDKNKV